MSLEPRLHREGIRLSPRRGIGCPPTFIDWCKSMKPELSAREVLRQLGMKGILTEPPEKGGVMYLLCDMDVCYCPRGRGYFEPISRDSEGRLVSWMPTEEHWPEGQAEGGRRINANVWLAHRLCNKLAYGVGPGYERKRQQAKSRQLEWSAANPTDYFSGFGNREAVEAWWREHSSRRVTHVDLAAPLSSQDSDDT